MKKFLLALVVVSLAALTGCADRGGCGGKKSEVKVQSLNAKGTRQAAAEPVEEDFSDSGWLEDTDEY